MVAQQRGLAMDPGYAVLSLTEPAAEEPERATCAEGSQVNAVGTNVDVKVVGLTFWLLPEGHHAADVSRLLAKELAGAAFA